jgi:hypothetical protein
VCDRYLRLTVAIVAIGYLRNNQGLRLIAGGDRLPLLIAMLAIVYLLFLIN